MPVLAYKSIQQLASLARRISSQYVCVYPQDRSSGCRGVTNVHVLASLGIHPAASLHVGSPVNTYAWICQPKVRASYTYTRKYSLSPRHRPWRWHPTVSTTCSVRGTAARPWRRPLTPPKTWCHSEMRSQRTQRRRPTATATSGIHIHRLYPQLLDLVLHYSGVMSSLTAQNPALILECPI